MIPGLRAVKTPHLLIAGAVLVGLWLWARGPMPQPWNMHASPAPGGLYGGGQ